MRGARLEDTVRKQVLTMIQGVFGQDQVVDTEDGICVVLSGHIVLIRVDEARLEVTS